MLALPNGLRVTPVPSTVTLSDTPNLSTSKSNGFITDHSTLSSSIPLVRTVPAANADTLPSLSINKNLVSQIINILMLVTKQLLEYSLQVSA